MLYWRLVDLRRDQVTAGHGAAGTSTGSESSAQQQLAARRVTRMCLIIVTTFTVAWLPYQLNVFVMYYGRAAHRSNALSFLEAAETIAYVNSCVNPIVYALKWRPFRLSLIQVRHNMQRQLSISSRIFVVAMCNCNHMDGRFGNISVTGHFTSVLRNHSGQNATDKVSSYIVKINICL